MTNNLINEFSKTYAYVPEMAILKFIEIIRVKKSIPQKKINCVLDIGGGNGIVFSKLKNFFDFQFTINSDLYGIENENYDLILSEDFSKTIIGKNKIDLSISINSLEHIENISKILEKINFVLKENGKLIITTPKNNYIECHPIYIFLNKIGLSNLSKKYKNWEHENAHHKSVQSEKKWEQLLKKNKFKNINIIEFFPKKLYFMVELLNISAKLHKSWHFWNFTNRIFTSFNFLKNINAFALSLILNRIDNYSIKNASHLLIIAEKK